MYNFAHFLQNVQFHRVPFLSIHLLDLLIPQMDNLTVLGIYQCQLINLGDTMDLLRLVRIYKKQSQLTLDFFPNYHVGPPDVPGNIFFVGTYGVTWDNWNANTILATWALVYQILKKARAENIDFESPHTMFRKWLDKSPCWKVEETIKALMDPSYDPIKLAALVDCSNPDHGGKAHRFCQVEAYRPQGWEW